MPIHHKLADGLDKVDIIIVGGGTAGCTVAGRLAAADPNLSVLLIEGGTNNHGVENVVNPAFFLDHLAPGAKTSILYKANKSEHLAGREAVVHTGGILGGGSSINFMMYTRAQGVDYDAWNTPGWSFKEVLPYLRKFETYHGRGKEEHHGYSGPVQVAPNSFRSPAAEEELIQAAARLGYPEIEDLQDFTSSNGFSRWCRYVSADGKRSDAAHAFLHPLLEDGKHPNLHVLVESKVLRVLFDGTRAVGVEYTPNEDYQPALPMTTHPKVSVRARKMVVLSAGSLGSPAILERSGVGSPEYVSKGGAPLVSDLPGVGHGYQDHHMVLSFYKTSLKPDETLDDIFAGRVSHEEAVAAEGKKLGWNGIDAAGKLRPSEEEVARMNPGFRTVWEKHYKNQPERPLLVVAPLVGYLGDPSTVPAGQYLSIANIQTYPLSRGQVHITGPAVSSALDFDAGFLNDPVGADLTAMVWSYKKTREIVRRTRFYRGEVAGSHPKFPDGSKAAAVDVGDDVDVAALADLEYTSDDDRAIEQHIRETVGTTWHSLGTTKMAPREEMGVVDRELNVYGVEGLKIVDLGIAPGNVASNTNNTAFMIGEKGADIIGKELGLTV